MKRLNWQLLLAIGLIAISTCIYLLHYAIWRDSHHILIYLVGDIAFVPAEVLLVTLILHRLLEGREKRSKLKKLNMVIGVFYSEVGTELMERLIAFDSNFENVRSNLIPKTDWSFKDFIHLRKHLGSYGYELKSIQGDMASLKFFLVEHRAFLLRLLENPTLLEHESFTELLWAVFHLEEELTKRKSIDELPGSDHKHLSGDMKRVYVLLIREWIGYMNHLRIDYPYLYSLAVRTNPFDPEAVPEVT